MPLSLEIIAQMFRPALRLQLLDLGRLFAKVGEGLKKHRDEDLLPLERESREFPVLAYFNDAVYASVEPGQFHSLTDPDRERGIGATLAEAARRFVAGLARPGEAVREELILPRLSAVFADVFEAIAASVERFARPGPWMFDQQMSRASDLFGQAALLGAGVVSATPQLLQIRRDAIAAQQRLRAELPPGERRAAAPPGDLADRGVELPDLLDAGARLLLGGVLALSALPSFLDALIGAGAIRARLAVLELFEGVERSLRHAREEIHSAFTVDLPDLIAEAMSLVLAAQVLVVANLRYSATFVAIFGAELVSGLRVGLMGTSFLVQLVVDVANVLLRIVAGIADVLVWILNLVADSGATFVKGVLVVGEGLVDSTADVVDAVGYGHDALRYTGRAISEGWEALWHWRRPRWRPPPPSGLHGSARTVRSVATRAAGLRDILAQLQASTPPLPPDVAIPPALVHPAFPDIGAALFGSGVPAFGAQLARRGAGIAAGVSDMVLAVRDGLMDLAGAMDRRADEAAMLGSPEVYDALRRGADSVADRMFGEQIAEQSRIMATRPHRLAEAFEDWMRFGGLQLIGAAIPRYVGELVRSWEEREAEGAELTAVITPTSPHILARRAELAQVRMRRMTLRVAGAAAMDARVAAAVAARFRGAVGQAYADGRRRHRQIVEAQARQEAEERRRSRITQRRRGVHP